MASSPPPCANFDAVGGRWLAPVCWTSRPVFAVVGARPTLPRLGRGIYFPYSLQGQRHGGRKQRGWGVLNSGVNRGLE